MGHIVIVDTSIFLNLLDVPGFNQHKNDTAAALKDFVQNKADLLLPLAAVFETGNHIAQLPDGRQRRQYAEKFVRQVEKALTGHAPWVMTPLPDHDQLRKLLIDFPECATRQAGMGDLTIIKEWEAACARHPRHRVSIWTLDGDLDGHDRCP